MAFSASGSQWSWPDDLAGPRQRRADASSAHADAHAHAHQSRPDGVFPQGSPPTTPGPPPPQTQQQQKQRHYKPRTCRICLDVVQPSADIDESVAGGLFPSRTRVRYVSDDPELGRLISPCKCKGSQKYVHEGCLQQWRRAAPMSDRNFWRCPTCHFQYRMQRLRWGRWMTSKLARAGLTLSIMVVTVFFLGFVADPIISLWVDPLGSIADTFAEVVADVEAMRPLDNDEPATWSFHFLKGFLSLGLLGFLKTFLAMSPWHWFNLRAGVGGRRRGTGRDRIESINWALVIVGVITFLGATWKLVSHFSAQALERAGDRVIDVQGDEPDEDDDE